MIKRIDIDKAAVYSIIINGIQICAVLSIALIILLTNIEQHSALFVEFIICLATVLVAWGAIVDIQQALSARRVNAQTIMLEEAYGQLEALNISLRAQRHDFMNHLQVVGGLVEMEEYPAAQEYIDKVYGDIKAVSTTLRTGNAAVDALLKVKMGECQRRGVFMDLHVYARWEKLPIQGWEMCRVLGNLIDNALDALENTLEPKITLILGEEEREGRAHFHFAVENNGPQIPEEYRERLFLSGFTTKGRERGMGLAIVKAILRENGGGIDLSSNQEKTAFTGWIPKAAG